jgi:hypothetical protein
MLKLAKALSSCALVCAICISREGEKETPALRREPGLKRRETALRGFLPGFGLRLGLGLAVELANGSGADFPSLGGNDGLARSDHLHFPVVLAGAQLTFDHDVIALGQRFHRFGQSVPGDDAMPVGVGLPVAGGFVLPRDLGGQPQDGESIVLVGLVGEEADERDAVEIGRGGLGFLFCLFVLFHVFFLFW